MGIEHEKFENISSILGRHPDKCYTGGWRSPTLLRRCHRETLLVASFDTQGYGGHILPPPTGQITDILNCFDSTEDDSSSSQESTNHDIPVSESPESSQNKNSSENLSGKWQQICQ